MQKRDPIRTLCDDIWEELFEAIDAAASLRRREKSVLAYLWNGCKTRSLSSARYPGHESVGATLGISPLGVHASLVSLERKGYIKAITSGDSRKSVAYRLNAFLLECAYDKVRLKKTS